MQFVKFDSWKSLCKDVHHIIFNVEVFYLDFSFGRKFSDEMMTNLYVPSPSMKNWIFCHCNYVLVVTMHDCCPILFLLYVGHDAPKPHCLVSSTCGDDIFCLNLIVASLWSMMLLWTLASMQNLMYFSCHLHNLPNHCQYKRQVRYRSIMINFKRLVQPWNIGLIVI